jgi:hypothetical protein
VKQPKRRVRCPACGEEWSSIATEAICTLYRELGDVVLIPVEENSGR